MSDSPYNFEHENNTFSVLAYFKILLILLSLLSLILIFNIYWRESRFLTQQYNVTNYHLKCINLSFKGLIEVQAIQHFYMDKTETQLTDSIQHLGSHIDVLTEINHKLINSNIFSDKDLEDIENKESKSILTRVSSQILFIKTQRDLHLNSDHHLFFEKIEKTLSDLISSFKNLEQVHLFQLQDFQKHTSQLKKEQQQKLFIIIALTLLIGTYISRQIYNKIKASMLARREIEANLLKAITNAESANKAKGEFLAVMSHEIRTPLNVMLGMAELLREQEKSTEKLKRINTIKKAGDGLTVLISDILDLTMIESSRLKLDNIDFNLKKLIADCISLQTYATELKKLNLYCNVSEEVPEWVKSDPYRLKQIIWNLIGNAIKFTESGSITLDVQLNEHKDQIYFAVTDTGMGINETLKQTIFEPFFQADSSGSRNHGGVGIGLALCKRLLDLMDGNIGCISQIDQGSCFWFTIPKHTVPHDEIPVDGEETQIFTIIEDDEETKHQHLSNHKILFAEDAEDNRTLFKAFLNKLPYQYAMVENGLEAFELFKKEKFDLVLMDIQMPIMDGFEATKKIRAWEKEQGRTPAQIVAITAHAMNDCIQEAKSVGCNDHLSKPITGKKIRDYIKLTFEN